MMLEFFHCQFIIKFTNFIAEVAQLVEQRFCKPQVVGSSPSFGSIYIHFQSDKNIYSLVGRYRSGQTGQTVNLLAFAFGGSNPPLPTIKDLKIWRFDDLKIWRFDDLKI